MADRIAVGEQHLRMQRDHQHIRNEGEVHLIHDRGDGDAAGKAGVSSVMTAPTRACHCAASR